MIDKYPQSWGARGKLAAATSDRILIGSCAVVWLALVGMSDRLVPDLIRDRRDR